ncbi:S1 family peptidase [Spongiimicrobium salis]|uniref:S1 family peptidase n=1 Tax=Spongiimicrobium salis TaxID=1667022 RepID=UPI00374DF245
MADTLIKLFRSRTVLVRAKGAVGTGSLIAPGKVLTCAHVVRSAAQDLDQIEVLMPNPTEPGHFVWTETAVGLQMSKIYEESRVHETHGEGQTTRTLQKEYPDVALIQIGKTNHRIVSFAAVEKENDLRDKQFLAFGFQKKDRDLQRNVPQAVSLNYSGEEGESELVRKLIFTNGLIRPGMSGAALIERESGEIVGIVQMTLSANDDLGAYVIPTAIIWQVFRKWEEEGENTLFSELQSKAVRRQLRKEYSAEYPRYPMYKKYGLRLALLPLLLFFGIWWVFFHLGQIQDSGILAIILVALGLSGKIVGDWLGEDVHTETGKLRTVIGEKLFSWTFIGVFSLIVFLGWSCTSSLWIYGNSDFDETEIVLIKDKDTTAYSLESLEKKRLLFFKPFLGDSLEIMLKPDGREKIPVHLKAYHKRELYYPRDFLLEPVVLIRFDHRYRLGMRNFTIQLTLERENKAPEEYIIDDLEGIGGITVGSRTLGITEERKSLWRRPFERTALSDDNINILVTHWSAQRVLQHIDLERNDYIKVAVKSKLNDSILNEQRYSIRKDKDTMDKLLKFR